MKSNLFRIPAPTAGLLSTMLRPRGGDWLDDDRAAFGIAHCVHGFCKVRDTWFIAEMLRAIV